MKHKLLALVGFSSQRHQLKTEILSGLTTFITMSYILALMPVNFQPLGTMGFPVDSVFTSTILATIAGTLFMAFFAKRPFGQAPGLTLNVFFIQTICLSMGYSWQFALTSVLIEGLLFAFLCMSNMRQLISEMIPPSLKYAIAAGIGFFIAMIGLKNGGLIGTGTIFNHIHTLTNSTSLVFFIGLVLSGIFAALRIKGGLLMSIIIVTLIGIPLGLTIIPDQLFSRPASPMPLFCQFSWIDLLSPDLWVCVLTMLFFDIFDSLGTIVGVMASSGVIRKNGRIPHMRAIMLSDAFGTIAGACFGCSTVTTYAESATGVAEGGRSGLSALVIALCFAVSLFCAPLFLTIPVAATAPVMVMAGFYLFSSVRYINISKPTEALPSFICILMMPITGSITDGIIFGLLTYITITFIEYWSKRLRVNRRKRSNRNG